MFYLTCSLAYVPVLIGGFTGHFRNVDQSLFSLGSCCGLLEKDSLSHLYCNVEMYTYTGWVKNGISCGLRHNKNPGSCFWLKNDINVIFLKFKIPKLFSKKNTFLLEIGKYLIYSVPKYHKNLLTNERDITINCSCKSAPNLKKLSLRNVFYYLKIFLIMNYILNEKIY